MDYAKQSLALHRRQKGKIEIRPKVRLENKRDLALSYTPGVAGVCTAIRADRERGWELTNRANTVAIVTDGTAILGLGNIGPEAGMPVMEGKSAIFKRFANIDAVPLCIRECETDDIVRFCKTLEPSFGGINLEDISAPRCFEILKRLEQELKIPVFHDDQDGTAIVTLAALVNACLVLKRDPLKQRIVVNGAGAAGIAITRLLIEFGADNIVLLDSIGTIYGGRKGLNKYKAEIAKKTNKKKIRGRLEEAMRGADVLIGVSKGNLADAQMVGSMNPSPIVFAMANPIPEIMPEKALSAGAAIVGTGRSDLPNQINNALVFPGIFRGLLDRRINKITREMKIRTALALAGCVSPRKDRILPDIFDKKVVKAVARAVKA